MMQQQSLLSVLGLQGIVPVQQQMQIQVPLAQMIGIQQPGQVAEPVQKLEQGVAVSESTCDNRNYTEEDVKKYEMEPELNELLDFSFCGD